MKRNLIKGGETLVLRAVGVLFKELGPVDASRFLMMPRKKRMESVKKHRLWQAQLDEKEVFDRIFGPTAKSSQITKRTHS